MDWIIFFVKSIYCRSNQNQISALQIINSEKRVPDSQLAPFMLPSQSILSPKEANNDDETTSIASQVAAKQEPECEMIW